MKYYLSDKKIPAGLLITVSATSNEEFEITKEDERKLSKSIRGATIKTKRPFRYKVIVSYDEQGKRKISFGNAKILMLSHTGIYDRLIPAPAWKSFINQNLLPGKTPIARLFRVTLDGEMVEF